jgi:hypothetical protein
MLRKLFAVQKAIKIFIKSFIDPIILNGNFRAGRGNCPKLCTLHFALCTSTKVQGILVEKWKLKE